MTQLLCHALNDPNDPWYYVIGVLALLLVFGGLTAYILIEDRLKKKKSGNTDGNIGEGPDSEQQADADETDEADETDDAIETNEAGEQPQPVDPEQTDGQTDENP